MSVPSFKNLYAFCKNIFGRLLATDGLGEPSIEVVIPITIIDAATGDVDTVVTSKFEVTGMECLKRNGAGAANTMQLKKAAAVISDAVACAVDNAVTRAASIDDAAGVNVFLPGETLRVTATRAAGTRDCLILVRGLLRN